MYRSHTCGQLRAEHIGQEVTLSGWVHSRRDHGGLIFIDFRDRYGLTQIVFDPEIDAGAHTIAEKVRSEWCLKIIGKVRARDEGMTNPKLETGEIEVEAIECEVLNESETPPFEIDKEVEVGEEVRYHYRYLDLRRDKMKNYLQFRANVLAFIREWYHSHDFLEISTPILTASSPEGARDFLVPSRKHPGRFYALPQAPQQFKQLLMVAGVDRYFQIAPCFRDEDPRSDRVAEHYQIDTEVSFMTQDEFLTTMEPLFIEITEKFSRGRKCATTPFPRIPFREAILRWTSDKPDLRFSLEVAEITEMAQKSGFGVFANSKVIRALRVPKRYGDLTRKDINELTSIAQQIGAGGLAWVRVGEQVGPVANNSSSEFLQKLDEITANPPEALVGFPSDHGNFGVGDLILFGAGEEDVVVKSLNAVRNELGQRLQIIDKSLIAWAWITDFPFFSVSEITGQLDFEHNPFSMPQGGMESLQNKKPEEILAWQYDLVANGFELSSGGVRNHKPETLLKGFQMVGYSEQEVRDKFGHMLTAFKYGAPPHCGFAPGVERLLTVLCGEENIRELIAFPKTGSEEDLLMHAPGEVSQEQLQELNLEVK